MRIRPSSTAGKARSLCGAENQEPIRGLRKAYSAQRGQGVTPRWARKMQRDTSGASRWDRALASAVRSKECHRLSVFVIHHEIKMVTRFERGHLDQPQAVALGAT